MSTTTGRSVAVLLAALVLFGRCESTEGPGDRAMTVAAAVSVAGLPPADRVTLVGGTPDQRRRMGEAVERFSSAGLRLPPLTVEFGSRPDECSGHHGVFRPRTMTIVICSAVESVYEHELAHAWERTTLTDETRSDFMALRGYDSWSDPEEPWNRRGVEGVAFVIQQGLATTPLPPVLGDEFTSRMSAFELLTDRPAPRLREWMEDRAVPCADRPTPLSHELADNDGLVCSTIDRTGVR